MKFNEIFLCCLVSDMFLLATCTRGHEETKKRGTNSETEVYMRGGASFAPWPLLTEKNTPCYRYIFTEKYIYSTSKSQAQTALHS